MCTKLCYLKQSNLHMRPPLVKRQPFPPPPTHTPQSKHQNFPSQRATMQAEGDCHYAKISGNFGANVNGTVWPRWNFSVKVVHLQKWSSLTCRSGPTKNCRSVFRNCRFQSRSSSSLHTLVKMADSSDVSVYECSVCM